MADDEARGDATVGIKGEGHASDGPADAFDDELVSHGGFRPAQGVLMGRYLLGRRIGSGGMGIVFEAEDTKLRRRVAVKFLRPALVASRASLERFLREAQTASQIDHPNVVSTYDVGDHDGLRYVILELLSPRSAKDFVATEGALQWSEATRVAADCCRALAAAHAAGLIHRDIKPDNILRSRKGVTKLTDFGLAKPVDRDSGLTRSGTVLGTPHYMSPEQCQARELDVRSDLYSLGASYYALLTGERPFGDKDGAADLSFAHCFGPVPDPGDRIATLPESVRRVVRTAMAKRPDDRYQTAEEMLLDLEGALLAAPQPEPAPRFLFSGSGSYSGDGPPSLGRTPRTTPAGTGLTAFKAVGTATTIAEAPPRRRVVLLAGAVLAAGAGVWIGVHRLFPEPIQQRGAASASPSAPLASVAAAPAGPPLRVGVLHSLSGTMAISEKSVVDATLLAIDEINEHGGVLGRPIDAVVADGRSDWPTFAREAERLINDEHVPVVFGGWTSASRKTMRPVFERNDHLLFYPVQYEGLEQSPNIVYTGAAPNQQILPALKWCTGYLGARKFFLVGSDYVFPRTANAIIRDALAQQKAEVVGEDYLLLGATDARALVAKVKAARPDVILNTINGDSNVAFFRTLREAGLGPKEVPTVSFSVGEDELRQITGVSLAGDYLAWNYFQSVDRPENRGFIDRFRKKYGSYRVTTDPMEAAYFGVHLWARAVAKAGKEAPRDVRAALHDMTFAAPGANVRIDATNQHTWKVFRLGKVTEAGTVDIVFSTESPIAPEPFPSSRTPEAWQDFLTRLFEGWGKSWANPGR